MTQLFAQPYDLAAEGFYFDTAEDYSTKAKPLRNDYGEPVEEFEIQFIDGESIDCDLANAISLNQANFARFFEIVDEWEGRVNSWPLDEGLIDYVSPGYGQASDENKLYAANVITAYEPPARRTSRRPLPDNPVQIIDQQVGRDP